MTSRTEPAPGLGDGALELGDLVGEVTGQGLGPVLHPELEGGQGGPGGVGVLEGEDGQLLGGGPGGAVDGAGGDGGGVDTVEKAGGILVDLGQGLGEGAGGQKGLGVGRGVKGLFPVPAAGGEGEAEGQRGDSGK